MLRACLHVLLPRCACYEAITQLMKNHKITRYLQMPLLIDRQDLVVQKSHYFQEDVGEIQGLSEWRFGKDSEYMGTWHLFSS